MLFWYLQLNDIHCPQDKYHSTIETLHMKEVNEIIKDKKGKHVKAKQKSISLLKDERNRILSNIEKHEAHIKTISEKLLEEISVRNHHNIRIYFIQYCMYPRLMFSPRDAIYVVKFIVMLNKLKTPYFNVIGLIGLYLKEVIPCIL